MNIKLIATKAFPYGRRQLKVGDRFEATDKDAVVLRAMKRVEDDHATTTTAVEDSAPSYTRDLEPLLSRDLIAAGESDAPTQSNRARRRYNRRDMKAEET